MLRRPLSTEQSFETYVLPAGEMEGGEEASQRIAATAQHAGNYSPYSHVFEFEKKFDERVAQNWVLEHWVPMTAWTGSIYVILVFTGQAWMASRPAYQLRGPLAAWSAFLAVFSICGFLRVFPEFVHSLTTGGIYDSVCNSNFVDQNKVSGFWTFLFTLSKMPELGDTVFIVLRKQQLIFLHWYHHLTVLVYTFYCYSQFTSTCRWFMTMNYFVHALMYTYFTLRALRIRVPKGIAMTITSLQLVQMVVGCTINYLAFQYKQNGRECGVSNDNLVYGSIMYFSYFLLFARFFYKAYFCKSERKSQEKLTELPANETPVSFGTVLQAGDKPGSNKECDSFIAVGSNIDSSEEKKKEK